MRVLSIKMDKRIGKKEIREILAKRFEADRCKKLSDIPSPSLFKDMKKATSRIVEAIQKKQKIVIVGDYDADGVISSVILSEFFDDNHIEYDLIIPNRFRDGYGVSADIVNRVDADIIITVDNGISAVEAGEVCEKKGIDLIITDHHTVPDTTPKAYAVVNPKQSDCAFPNSEICGAVVAWYLVASLKEELKLEYNLGKFLDILAIAIIADMMPLNDINRIIVKSGLKKINSSNRAFLQAVKDYYRKDSFLSEDISYLLAPLINSAGRLEDATLAYELIKERDLNEAYLKLEYIASLNNERKEIESDLLKKAIKSVEKDQKIVIVWGDDWHEGVIGIVAAKLSRKFKVPSIVFSITDGVAKGSARSIGEIDILKHVSKCSSLLLGFGGHKGAAGMSLEEKNLEDFKRAMQDSLKEEDEENFKEKKKVLGVLDADEVDLELLDILEYFEPYGQENPRPRFVIKDAYVKGHKLLGRDKNHQKILISSKNGTVDTIDFNFEKKVSFAQNITFTCTVSKNSFRGIVSPQLVVDELILD